MVQMPALNTPQFDWARSRLSQKLQPVPPIYQPEIAAAAIYWAAHHRRREIFVGAPSVKAIWANRFFPGLLDHYLAKTAVSAQQTGEPSEPNRPDNLWKPIPGDHGAHGRFDARACEESPQLWATEHRKWIFAAAAAGIAIGWFLVKRNRS